MNDLPAEPDANTEAEPGGEWRRTDPLGLIARCIINLQKAVLPLIAVSVGGREWASMEVILAMILLVLLINGLTAWLGWRHHRYRIGQDDIRVERGLISRSARSVPYERIQDVAIEEALIPRLLGLVEVRFETGAGGKDEVKLAFVSRAQGEALRQTVRARQENVPPEGGGEAPGGLPHAPAAPAARRLFAMDARRLVTFGLFEFSLVIFALLFGLAEQFDFLLPFNIWDFGEWQARADLPFHLMLGLGMAAQAVAAILALIVLFLLGLVSGIGRTVLRDHGFLLEETERGLRRRRGLLTRTDVVMPVHRVQALKVTTGIVRRQFGWHGLELVSLAQDARSASHTVVPFGQMEEIGPVVEVVRFALPGPGTEWRRPSPRHRFDQALLSSLPAAVGAGGLLLAGLALPALGLAAVAALLATRQVFLWRHDRHAVDERFIYVRHGWLAPRLDVGSRVKLQSTEIAQGPLARRRGYATLLFGVAGGTLKIEGLALQEARAIRAEVLESISAIDFSRLPGQRAGEAAGDDPARPAPMPPASLNK